MPGDELVSVRYMVNDVQESIDFYTHHLGFTVQRSSHAAFRRLRGNLRPARADESRAADADGRTPGRTASTSSSRQLADVERAAAARGRSPFRNDIISGPGGQQILLEDPSGNPIELFQPAGA